MTEKVALIGAGAMGGAIGTRLLATGHALAVCDRSPEKVQELVDKGATSSPTPADAASKADFVITSLNSSAIVEAVVFGKDGVIEGAKPGTTIIDMSSIAPDATAAMAERAAQAGLRWVDSPLSGGAPKALIGELTLMAGGTEGDVQHAYKVLKHLAANYTHMGPAGTGQATKLINQVLGALGFLAVAEATRLAMDAGVDAAKIPVALKGGRADSALLQEYMPRYVARDFRRTGRIDNMVKDLNMVQDLARKTNTAMPLTSICAEVHRLMTAAGHGGEDQAYLIEYFSMGKAD